MARALRLSGRARGSAISPMLIQITLEPPTSILMDGETSVRLEKT
jgi:hypothetical protein